MTRLHTNLQMGTISDNPLLIGATSMNSPAFASLPAVVAPDYLVVTIDPARINGAPEIVYVTAHTAAATTATVLRGQESSTARQHAAGETWIHGATALDFWGAGGTWVGYQYVDGILAQSGAPQTAGVPITGYLRTNALNAASTTALNPGLTVYGGDGVQAIYGIDLGYLSATYTMRFISGGAAQMFSWGNHAVANPTLQSQFTEVMRLTNAGVLSLQKALGGGTTSVDLYPTYRRIESNANGAMRFFNSLGANSNPFFEFWRSDGAPTAAVARVDVSAVNAAQALSSAGTFGFETSGAIGAHAFGSPVGAGTSRGMFSFADNDAHSWESDGAGGWLFRNGWNSAAAAFKFYGGVGGVLLARFGSDSITLKAPTWHNVGAAGEPAFTNSWVNYAGGWTPARFALDSEGWVHLEGLIANGSASVAIFTLPAGYRPTANHMFNVIAGGGGFARVDVLSDGTVYVAAYYSGGTNGFTQLDGIKFSVN